MVANPFVSGADSTFAIELGGAIRAAVQNEVGDDYAVVTQQQMNEALAYYGFPANAILNASLATTLAKNISAPVLVTAALTRAGAGPYTVTARLVGVSDEAGNVVEVAGRPNERPADLGARVAKALMPAVKSLNDARACVEQRETKPDNAAKAAAKAVKTVPNHGLAHFCLYQIAEQRKEPRAEAVKHLEVAVKGDPLSVSAWRLLAGAYQAANDTAKAVAAAKQLLRIAPADQELRERVFRYLLESGQPKAALDVAEEGLKADPLNPELYDLKANACLFLRDFPCAVTALEQRYGIDSAKVDTLFFAKVAAAATAGDVPDTARLLRWSQAGVRKFPDNRTILGYLGQAYVLTGQVDSGLAVTRRIMAVDTTAVAPALAAVQALITANRAAEAEPYVTFVKRYGDQTRKNQLARVLAAAALTRLRGDSATKQPPDLAGAVELSRTAVDVADSASEDAQYGNFVLGAALFQQAAELDPRTERQKSCDLVRQEQQLVTDAQTALTRVQLTQFETAKQQYLGYITKLGPRIKAMQKAYCRSTP
jgi:predicted Zn-dependent protease